MKVYYEFSDELTAMIALFESMGEVMHNLVKDYANALAEKNKFKLMWTLRSMENEIEEEGGCIVITKSGRIQAKDFTQETSDKIHELLKPVFQ